MKKRGGRRGFTAHTARVHDTPLDDPFDALVDPSTACPLVVPIAGPALEALGPALPREVSSAGEIEALPTPRQGDAWDRLCDELATEQADGEVVLAAALRRALVTGSVRLALPGDAPDAAIDLVRLPRRSALFEVRRGGETARVLEAHDVLFTGSAVDWGAFSSQHPEVRVDTLRRVERFAMIRREGDAATTSLEAAIHVEEHRVIDGVTEIVRHRSAAVPLADWMWCGHRVWGYSMLMLWFDAAPEAVARWFQGWLRARPASPTPECPDPRPDWEIGVDGEVLFVRRSYEEPTDAHQLQWERWALARALEAPFELLSWRVTESDMGGLDAWGRDRASLRAYLSPDADPERRAALRAAYRAPSAAVVTFTARGVPALADALRAVLPALGSVPAAAPTAEHLAALARTEARARFPRRLVLSLPPRAGSDERAFELIAALEAAVAGTVTFSASWQT